MEEDALEKFTLLAASGDAGLRLDQCLANHVEGLSRNRLKALIKAGHVEKGDAIALTLPPVEDAVPRPENIPLDVVYEDDHLIVVDKPAGMVVHPAAGNWTGTLVNALIAHCGDSLSGIGGVRRPGIVHRLDKETSGLLVVAKTDAAHKGLSEQFADHGRSGPLERAYLALVWGVPERRSGSIDAPLGRSAASRVKQGVRTGDGRQAITHYRVLRALGGGEVAEVACRLETGRTHQIRVHMAHIRHPLLGDATYGTGFATKAGKLSEEARGALAALKRQALHAAVLGFEHPVTKEHLRFESPLPADIAALVKALRQ